jgi:hypothetical protein
MTSSSKWSSPRSKPGLNFVSQITSWRGLCGLHDTEQWTWPVVGNSTHCLTMCSIFLNRVGQTPRRALNTIVPKPFNGAWGNSHPRPVI